MNQAHPKHADAAHPIHPLLAQRFSPYLFEPRPVEDDKLLACLEAGRWAPSSYNEQPWTVFLGKRENREAFDRLLDCLVEANQGWAVHAGALLLTVTHRKFSRNGKPNKAAEHDVGLFAANFSVQATALGLHVHQMIGIEPAKARQALNVPEDYDPLTALAVGYAADAAHPETRDDEQKVKLAERDLAPRQRRPLEQWVFTNRWGESSPVL